MLSWYNILLLPQEGISNTGWSHHKKQGPWAPYSRILCVDILLDTHITMAAPTSQSWHQMLEWTYSGVDHSLPGNGGEECINFIPSKQKMMETAMFVTLGMMEILIGLKTVRLDTGAYKTRNMDPLGKRVLLLIMTLTFGIELGFKFSTRQMIWILNPCHIVTMMQVWFQAA